MWRGSFTFIRAVVVRRVGRRNHRKRTQLESTVFANGKTVLGILINVSMLHVLWNFTFLQCFMGDQHRGGEVWRSRKHQAQLRSNTGLGKSIASVGSGSTARLRRWPPGGEGSVTAAQSGARAVQKASRRQLSTSLRRQYLYSSVGIQQR